MSSSWIPGATEHLDFSIHNIPFGLFSTRENARTRPATRVADTIVDLSVLASKGLLSSSAEVSTALQETTLASFAALPAAVRRSARLEIQKIVSGPSKPDKFPEDALLPVEKVQMHVPMPIGDYTDYCIAIEHMKNAGRAISGDARIPAQMPFMPIGYHGRASSVVISGTPFKRPCGFFKAAPTDEEPVLGPSRKLDYEVEMAFYVATNTKMGQRLTVAEAEDAIFGAVLMNDWSSRDIQGFEMNPLGPFQGKNFATTVSAWVVTLEALKPFMAPLPERLKPEYSVLSASTNKAIDAHLAVEIVSKDGERKFIADKIRATDFYWSMPQLLVHQTLSGCPVKVGDLIATGTCSGKTEDSLGCIVETTEGGRKPWTFPSGTSRTFLEDGDNIIMTGRCSQNGAHVGFGECAGLVLPADPL